MKIYSSMYTFLGVYLFMCSPTYATDSGKAGKDTKESKSKTLSYNCPKQEEIDAFIKESSAGVQAVWLLKFFRSSKSQYAKLRTAKRTYGQFRNPENWPRHITYETPSDVCDATLACAFGSKFNKTKATIEQIESVSFEQQRCAVGKALATQPDIWGKAEDKDVTIDAVGACEHANVEISVRDESDSRSRRQIKFTPITADKEGKPQRHPQSVLVINLDKDKDWRPDSPRYDHEDAFARALSCKHHMRKD